MKNQQGTSNCSLLTLSIVSAIQGLVTFGALFMSLPTLFDLNVFDPNSGATEELRQPDGPGDLAVLESIVAAFSFAGGVGAATITLGSRWQIKNSNMLKVATVAYVLCFVISMIFSFMRINTLGYAYTWNLPFGTNTSTCLDTNWETGCPTTRFENKYDNTSWIKDDDFQIESIEQCKFNAYDNSSKIAYDSTVAGISKPDWADKTYYDVNQRELLVTAAERINLKAKTVDGKLECDYGTPDTTTEKCIIGKDDLPNIAWCWYWGCHDVCNDRYKVNQTWLVLSLSSTFLYLVLAVISGFAVYMTEKEEMGYEYIFANNVAPESGAVFRSNRLDFT
ncbi:MAG: hypothetical protein CMF41_04310 [Legionellales bacterium]|nr:hypothetical protein [Legionellales bacterium]